MKTLCTVLLVSLCYTSLAQDNDSLKVPGGIVKILPLQFISSNFFIQYEAFNDTRSKSVVLGIGVMQQIDPNYETVKGINGEFGLRKYIRGFGIKETKKGNQYIRGIFATVFVKGGWADITEENAYYYYYDDAGNYVSQNATLEKSGYWIYPGVNIGFTMSLWEVLFVEGFVGGGIKMSNFTSNFEPEYSYTDVFDVDYSGVMPNIGVAIGVSF